MGQGNSTLVVHVFLHPSTYLLLVGSTGGWHTSWLVEESRDKMTAELSDSSCDFANRAQTLAALELKSHEKNSLANGNVQVYEMSTEDEWEKRERKKNNALDAKLVPER